jgi:hypothetical protein
MPVSGVGGATPGGAMHWAPPVPPAAHVGAAPDVEQNEAQLPAPSVRTQVDPRAQSFAVEQGDPGAAVPAGAHTAPLGMR